MAEDVVAAQLELGFGIFGKVVADRDQSVDEAVERRVVADLDKVLDASTHNPLPVPGLKYRPPKSGRNA
jgi:hypothetical protein